MSVPAFNRHGVWAIYRFEMARFLRTILQSVLTPVITTALFVIVFGSAIGSRMSEVGGVSYGAFIVPGLIMLSLFTESIANASFGIHFPQFTGTIFEILSAPVAALYQCRRGSRASGWRSQNSRRILRLITRTVTFCQL